jgi:hypothetical protein
LSDAEKEELKKDIRNIEVKESLFSMGAWKAQDLMDFQQDFIKGSGGKCKTAYVCLLEIHGRILVRLKLSTLLTLHMSYFERK